MILVTGADGYLGWPLMLRLGKTLGNERIIGVDHLGRRKWVEQIGSVSALPVGSTEERMEAAKEHGFHHLSLVNMDLTDREAVYQLLSTYRPRAIIHLASQPAAPYSHINGQLADFTQENNNKMLRHLLWGLYELDLLDTHLIETTTTGVYGAPHFEIPEGFLDIPNDTGTDRIPYPGMATSWYHMSKANDINNLYLASRMWDLTVTDLRTSIVFGTSTSETRLDPRLNTRFDFDFYFGVVANRFCAQALAGYPITLYGKGEQKKPMIALEDAVESLVRAVELPLHGGFRVYNQMTELVSPKELATGVQMAGKKQGLDVEVKSVPNPRRENEEHQMKMNNAGFRKDLLPGEAQSIKDGIGSMMRDLYPYRKVFEHYSDRFMNR